MDSGAGALYLMSGNSLEKASLCPLRGFTIILLGYNSDKNLHYKNQFHAKIVCNRTKLAKVGEGKIGKRRSEERRYLIVQARRDV